VEIKFKELKHWKSKKNSKKWKIKSV